jgi:hypothetical protein
VIIEAEIIATLKTLFSMSRVYFGMAPQEGNEEALKFPLVIVNRVGTLWPVTFCGTDVDLEMAQIQVDFYDNVSQECRIMADAARRALSAHSLATEISFYDDVSRGWRITQTWEVSDYTPAIAGP